MKALKNWVIDHQVAAFFIIAFAITWGVGAPYDALLNDGQYLWLPVIFLAFTGPGLASRCKDRAKHFGSPFSWHGRPE
jgi:hypothetical protein